MSPPFAGLTAQLERVTGTAGISLSQSARRGENKTATVAARFDSGRVHYAFAEQKRFALPLGHSMEWLEQVNLNRIPPRITPHHMLAIVSVHDALLQAVSTPRGSTSRD